MLIFLIDQMQDFDAVVVASGHYHAPRIPDIPGLPEAKARWPSRIFHSKRYRRPDSFAGKVGYPLSIMHQYFVLY